MRSRDDWNQSLYGRGYTIQEILLGTQLPIPQVAQGFIQTVAASTGPPSASSRPALAAPTGGPRIAGAAPPHRPDGAGRTRAAVYPGTWPRCEVGQLIRTRFIGHDDRRISLDRPRGRVDSKAARLRSLLLAPELTFLMEAHDGLSAKIVEEAGFPAIWASGLTVSAALGVRDSNEASWTQVLEVLEFMADATSVPILLDGDTGYGNFNNVRRLVRKLCQRGVAAVCLEDKLFPKTNSFIGDHQPLADVDEFCGKIKAGKDSATESDFSIVARVEALIAGRGLDEALRRAEAYHAAGADAHPDPQQAPDRRRDPRLRRGVGRRAPAGHRAHDVLRHPRGRLPEGRYLGRHLGEPQPARRRSARCGRSAAGSARRRAWSASRGRSRACATSSRWPATGSSKRPSGATSGRRPPCRAPSSSPPRAAPRSGPLTAERPKCMIDVRGQPLLRRLCGTLRECGVGDITVVRGYRKEAIDVPSIATVDNDAYETTGEAASLACAIDRLRGPCVLSYGDILFRRHLLDALLAAEGDVVVAVDALQRSRADLDPERVTDLVGCSRRHTGDYLRGRGAGLAPPDRERPPARRGGRRVDRTRQALGPRARRWCAPSSRRCGPTAPLRGRASSRCSRA